MEFIESLKILEQSLQAYNQSEEQRSKNTRLMMLGSRFAEKIKGVDTVDGLAAMMIKGNQAAFAMGIPEFASQINNMGEIKRVELMTKEGKLQESQRASMLKGLYSDSMVLVDGEYKPLGETEQFKQVASMDSKLQADAYKYLYDTLQTKVTQQAQYLGNNKFGYSEYAVGRNNETKLIRSLLPIGNGKYDDAMKEGLQILDEPTLITQQRGAMLYEDEKDRRNFNQQLGLIQAQANKQKDLLDYQYDIGSKGQEQYYKDDKKWEMLKNATESNIHAAGNNYFEKLAGLALADKSSSDELKSAVGMLSQLKDGRVKAEFIKKDPLVRDYINKILDTPQGKELANLRTFYDANLNDLYYKTEHRRLYDKSTPQGQLIQAKEQLPAGTLEDYPIWTGN